MTEPVFSYESLLDHRDWMIGLARQLVDDPARADDIVQETMLEAVRRPPSSWSSPKGWLAAVARNVARGFARVEARRTRRERLVAKSEGQSSTAELVERATLHRQLVGAVLDLDEPYRSTLLMRFFDEMPPREIAERLGRPIGTVRTHIARGLERMRRELDEEHGDRRSWVALVLPLMHPSKSATTGSLLSIGGIMLILKIGIPVAAAAVLWAVLGNDEVVSPSSIAEPSSGKVRKRSLVAESSGVVRIPTEALVEPARLDDLVPLQEFRARIVDSKGRPQQGVAVSSKYLRPWVDNNHQLHIGSRIFNLNDEEVRAKILGLSGKGPGAGEFKVTEVQRVVLGQSLEREPAITDSEGRFTVSGVDDLTEIRLDHGWVVYGAGKLSEDEVLTIVAGPSVRFAGLVSDERGLPIEGVRFAIFYAPESLPGIAQEFVTKSSGQQLVFLSDTQGYFDGLNLPKIEPLKIELTKPGYYPRSFPVPQVDDTSVQITLKTMQPAARLMISGTVTLADGSLATGSQIYFGQDSVEADQLGRFELEVSYLDPASVLIAVTLGHRPAIVRGLGARLEKDRRAGLDLRLRMLGVPLEIRGQALDRDGSPLAGLDVWLLDATRLGTTSAMLEQWLGESDTHTDAEGRFVVPGLLDRSYRVAVRNRKTLLVLQSDSVPAGTSNLVLREGVAAFVAELTGVVVDQGGEPVAGVPLSVSTILFESKSYSSWENRDDKVFTDAAGEFSIPNCPVQNVFLNVGDDLWTRTQRAAIEDSGRSPMRIRIKRLFRFRLKPLPSATADRFEVENALGERQKVVLKTVSSTSTYHRAPLHKSDLAPVCIVEEGADHIVFYKDGVEVGRLDLPLRREEITDITVY